MPYTVTQLAGRWWSVLGPHPDRLLPVNGAVRPIPLAGTAQHVICTTDRQEDAELIAAALDAYAHANRRAA